MKNKEDKEIIGNIFNRMCNKKRSLTRTHGAR